MAHLNPRTDRDILTKEAYATDEQLATRIRTHELYTRPKVDFPKWVIDSHAWRGDEWVLDIGSGPGTYFALVQERAPHGRHIAGDLSLGMARLARQNPNASQIDVLNLDAQALPFADQMFDVVLANHMLYHVPDVPLALSEIRRVLKPDGCLIAATNSTDNMPEFDTLARRACTLLGFPRADFGPEHRRFALENGAQLLAHEFRAVARCDLPSALHFNNADPVVAYLDSVRALRAPQLPSEISWDEFMAVMEKQITRLIRRDGELQVQKLAGVLIGTNGGGFARDYLTRFDTL